MKKLASFAFIILVVAGVSLACNVSAPAPRPTADLARIVEQTETAMAVAQTTAVALTPAPANAATPTPPGQANPTAAAQTPGAPTAAACTHRAELVAETIPAGTQFPAREQFMKTWTLRNTGDCTWTPEYSLVFAGGEQMSGTSPAPIGQTVAPGGSIQLFLPQTAPDTPGEHQGSWRLRPPSGPEFGLGESAAPFEVKINVAAGLPTSAPANAGLTTLGAPTSTITFSANKAPFYLGEDDDIAFEVRNNALTLTAFRQAGDQWRVAELGAFENLAIEARFRAGTTCSGRDGYGLLVRAPNASDGIIDSGYVFGFNCEGQYRVYRMDGGGYTGIVTWSNNPSLKSGPNQENVMTVIAQDDRLQLFGNGTLLYEFFDAVHPSGLWGLMIGSGGSTNFSVEIPQILLWKLP